MPNNTIEPKATPYKSSVTPMFFQNTRAPGAISQIINPSPILPLRIFIPKVPYKSPAIFAAPTLFDDRNKVRPKQRKKSEYKGMPDSPLLVRFEREKAGKKEVIHLIGVRHISRYNWAKEVPATLISQSNCLAVEEVTSIALDVSQARMHQWAKDFYDLKVEADVDLYSFEHEIAKRYVRNHSEPAEIIAQQLENLEDRQATLLHFTDDPDYTMDKFRRLVMGERQKEVNAFREKQMAEKMVSIVAERETLLAVVGGIHLLRISELLMSPEHGFRQGNTQFLSELVYAERGSGFSPRTAV